MKPRDVLIMHQRTEEGCLCGTLTIGDSHADHVISELDKAGFEIKAKPKVTLYIGPPKPEVRYVPVPDPRQRY